MPDLIAGWEEMRALYEFGVPATKIATTYKVNVHTLRDRAKRENWLKAKDVSERARQLLIEEHGDSDNPLLDKRARELIGRHMDLREIAHSSVVKAMKKFDKAARTPATFFEAESAMRIADKASGVDLAHGGVGKGGAGSNNPGKPGGPIINIAFLSGTHGVTAPQNPSQHPAHTSANHPHSPNTTSRIPPMPHPCSQVVDVPASEGDGEGLDASGISDAERLGM